MLLLPINNYDIHNARHQARPTEHFAVLPATTVYPCPIPGTILGPMVGLTSHSMTATAPSYLQHNVVGYPRQDLLSLQRSHSVCSSISLQPSISPVTSYAPSTDRVHDFPPRQEKEANSILYNLLNQHDDKRQVRSAVAPCCDGKLATGATLNQECSSVTRLCVGLRNPIQTFEMASKVLEKITTFVKNLESFKNLSISDQELLFANSWAKLFVLGMAQEKIQFDVVQYEVQVPSAEYFDHDSLYWSSLSDKEAAKADEAAKLKGFAQRCMELELTPVEYAYFMGTVLFDYDIPGLQQRQVIASLQAEALHALAEYRGEQTGFASTVQAEHHQHMRLAQILLGLPALKSTKTQVIADLFFREIPAPEPTTLQSLLTK